MPGVSRLTHLCRRPGVLGCIGIFAGLGLLLYDTFLEAGERAAAAAAAATGTRRLDSSAASLQ